MTDITEDLDHYAKRVMPHYPNDTCSKARREIERLRIFVEWVDSIVSNPVSSYSVHALDGLFGMTRDRIKALSNGEREGG